MVSAIGGTMGLCIGFSFFHFCGFILNCLEQAIQKSKHGRSCASSSSINAIGESRSTLEQINEKLVHILESEIKFAGKMSTLETSIKNLETRMIQLEKK